MYFSGLRRKRRNREGTIRLKEVTKLFDELRDDMAAAKQETNQRIDELHADMATKPSKEEMKQLIHESMRTDFPHKHLSESNIWSIHHIFSKSYLDGLRDLVDVDLNRILRAMWLLILFVNLALLALGMRPLIKDYLEEVTITKVGQIETNMSQLNRPFVCLTLLKDLLYQRSENGLRDELLPVSNDSLLYLGYIKAWMPLFASSGLWLSHTTSGNLTWSQFESIPARSSFSKSCENVSLLSQSALYDVLYYGGIGQTDLTTSKPSKFHYTRKLRSEILMRQIRNSMSSFRKNSVICLPISLSQFAWVAVNGKQEQWFDYKVYVTAERINISHVHQIFIDTSHFNTKAYTVKGSYPFSFLDSIYRYEMDDTRYLVLPTKHIHLNLTRQPCYDAFGEIYPQGFGEFICFQDCMWSNHDLLFNCSFWEDVNIEEKQSINVCHAFDIFHQLRSNMSQMCLNDTNHLWCNDAAMRPVEEWSQLLMETYQKLVIEKASAIGNCRSKCANFTFCEEWDLQFESLYEQRVVEFMNNSIDPNSNAGLVAYRLYQISSFVSVNEDVLKASPAEFISSLGGIIGFYFGASVCGYLHLLLSLFISCCRKVTKMVNKSYSGDRRSTNE